MSFLAKCPRCKSSILCAEIIFKGDVTWDMVVESLVKSGFPKLQEPPGDEFYCAVALCPGCGNKIADFLMGNTQIPEALADFTRKKMRYEAGETITLEMCQVTTFNATFVKDD